jgi:hypothetical protein
VILVFRGTEPTILDYTTDVSRMKTETIFGGVHTGFYNAFMSIWDDGDPDLFVQGVGRPGEGMRSFIFRRSSTWSSSRSLVVTGHSLGGALASLASVNIAFAGCRNQWPGRTEPLASVREVNRCRNATDVAGAQANFSNASFRPIQALYTFGAPRVGDELFGALLANLGMSARTTYRFTNRWDPFVSLPYFGYWHPHVDGDESARENTLPGAVALSHPIASYVKELRARVPANLEVPDPPPPETAKKNRWARAAMDERPDFVPHPFLSNRAQRHFDGYAQKGYTPRILKTDIDGIEATAVRVTIETETTWREETLLFDGNEFVVHYGYFDREGAAGRRSFVLMDEPRITPPPGP